MGLRVLFLLALLVPAVFGQGERGTFNGTVTDVSGAVVPNASVKATNQETGVETVAQTTSAGVYRMPYLQPGTYRFNISAPGFKTVVRENVNLSVAQTLVLDFTIEVGQVTDQVTVSAETPLLEAGNAEIGSYVTTKEFDTWPITVGDGRRQIQQFIFTSLPGAVGGTFQGTINGGQQYSHEILIDGLPLGRFDLQGGSNNEFSPSAESVSEFKLQTGVTSAQYSGGQTAVANFVTRSGTNELHGSAYYYGQNDALRANGFSNNAGRIKRQPFKQHNYGFSAGGPVVLPKIYDGRNKSFWYMNWERTKVANFTSTSFSTLPTPAFKQGDFSSLLNPAFTGNPASGTTVGTDAEGRPIVFGQIYDPATSRQVNGTWVRDPFLGNIIPQSRFSTISRNILSQAPITDPVFSTMLNNIPAIGTSSPIFDEKMFTIKGDQIISSNHRVSATLNRNLRARNNSPGGRWGVPPGTPTGVYQFQETPGWLGRAAWDWTIKPNWLNHFAMGYNRFGNLNQSVFVDQDWPQKIGYKNLPGTHFPTLTFGGQPFQGGGIGGGGRLGSANAGGSYNGSTIYGNDMTVIVGKHNFKFGVDHRRYYSNNFGRGTESGTFAFSPNQTALPTNLTQTGHAFASFLLGTANSTNRNVVASFFGYRWRSFGTYFQDDWKLTRKLTVNLGMRWETIGGLQEVAGRMAQFDPALANTLAGGRPGALIFADQRGVDTFMDKNWLQLSPKLGFAYAVSDKMVVRGGYGVNNMPPINNGFDGPSTIGYNGTITVNAANPVMPNRFNGDVIWNLDTPYPSFTSALPNRDATLGNGQSVTYVGRDHNRLPYVQNYNLGMQFALPGYTSLEINYVGNKGTRLPLRGFDNLNGLPFTLVQRYGNILQDPWTPASGVPAPYPGFNGNVLQALRPFPQYQTISQPYPYFGTSTYNGLQVQVTRHYRSGLAYLLAYTWSKSIAMTDSAIDSDFQGVSDIFNRSLERSITQFNYPHFFKATWIYELPIGKDKLIPLHGIANTLLGGWNLTGIHNIRSGNPLQITTGAVVNPVGAARPDLVLGQEIVMNSDAPINFRGINGGTTYLNRAAFAIPPTFPGANNVVQRLGTLGPYLPNIRGPYFNSFDASIEKQFRFGENAYFELRATGTNVMNWHGRSDPVTDLSNAFFGQITGVQQGPRNVELSARIQF